MQQILIKPYNVITTCYLVLSLQRVLLGVGPNPGFLGARVLQLSHELLSCVKQVYLELSCHHPSRNPPGVQNNARRQKPEQYETLKYQH